jgi:hypothetical protein
MKLKAKWMGIAVASAVLPGCATILGLDDFTEGAGGSGTSGATTSTTATTGTGGSTSSTSGTTASGSSTSSGTGGAPACAGTESMPCDTGLKGVCAPGTKTCAAGQFGMCVEDVASSPEDCKKPGDENCDGIACSDCVWGLVAGDASGQSITSLAIDPQGNVLIAGSFAGTLKLLNSDPAKSVTLTSFGGDDLFLAKLDPAGNALWGKHFGGAATQTNSSIAVATDKNGNLVISGGFTGTADFGGGAVTAPMMKPNPFVATYDGSGAFKWQVQLGGPSVFGYHVAAAFTSGGDVIVGGDYDGGSLVVPLAAGGSSTLANNGSRDIFVAKLTNASSGKAAWARRYGETIGAFPALSLLGALVVDSSDVIYLGGTFDSSISFTGNVPSKGGSDAFVAKLDGQGDASLAFTIGGGSDDSIDHLVVDTSGSILVSGITTGATDLGGGPIVTPAGGIAFLSKYSTLGAYKWAKTFASLFLVGLSTDPSDNIFLGGYMFGDIDFGGGALKFAGGGFFNADIAIAKLDTSGGHLWSKSFGDGGAQDITTLATDPVSKGPVLGGFCFGTVDFGTGLLTAAGAGDICLAKFQP